MNAYRLVFLAVAEPENPTLQQVNRFRAKLASAGLSDEDLEALRQILANFQGQVDDENTQAGAILARNPAPYPGSVDYQALLALSEQRQQAFTTALSAVPARLSTDGAAKLDAHVQNAKRGMKYLPSNPVSKP